MDAMLERVLYRVDVIVETPLRCHSTVQEYVVAHTADSARDRALARVATRGLVIHDVRNITRGRFVVEPEPK